MHANRPFTHDDLKTNLSDRGHKQLWTKLTPRFRSLPQRMTQEVLWSGCPCINVPWNTAPPIDSITVWPRVNKRGRESTNHGQNLIHKSGWPSGFLSRTWHLRLESSEKIEGCILCWPNPGNPKRNIVSTKTHHITCTNLYMFLQSWLSWFGQGSPLKHHLNDVFQNLVHMWRHVLKPHASCILALYRASPRKPSKHMHSRDVDLRANVPFLQPAPHRKQVCTRHINTANAYAQHWTNCITANIVH